MRRVWPVGTCCCTTSESTCPQRVLRVHEHGLWFGRTKYSDGSTNIVACVDRLSEMAQLEDVPEAIGDKVTAQMFIDCVFRQHGLPREIVSDRDHVSRDNFGSPSSRILVLVCTCPPPIIRWIMVKSNALIALWNIFYVACADAPRHWGSIPPVVEFSLNNAAQDSTG